MNQGPKHPNSGRTVFRRLARLVADALTGRLGVAMMVLGYSACAVVLLSYVSSQVYTYSLMEDIGARQRARRLLEEKIGLLTQTYAEMSSMERVTRICQAKLGMVPASPGQLVRVSVDTDWAPGVRQAEFGDEAVDLPGVMGRSMDEITEVIRR